MSSEVNAVAKAMRCFVRAIRARRLYHENNSMLVRAMQEMEAAFNETFATLELVTLVVRPDAFLFDNQAVLEESGTDSIPFAYYREGIRRLDLSRGLNTKELEVLIQATLSGVAFSGLGDDLVSFLWRHELEHVRYLVMETSFVDASDPNASQEEIDIAAHVTALIREIYGEAMSDVGPTSMQFTNADVVAKALAEQLAEVDEMAPGFHPARAMLSVPAYENELMTELQQENEARLIARTIFAAVETFTCEEDLAPADAEAIGRGLLRTFDSALTADQLDQAGRIISAFRSLSRFEQVARSSAHWLEVALSEARLRSVIVSHAASANPAKLESLIAFLHHAGSGAVSGILSALSGVPDPVRRRAIADVALELGIDDVAPLKAMLGGELGYLAEEALYILSKLPSEQTFDAGLSLFEDPELRQQMIGLRLIGVSRDPRGEEVLHERFQRSGFDALPFELKSAMLDAFALVASSKGISFLVRKINRANVDEVPIDFEETAIAAARAMRFIPTQGTVSALKRACLESNARVRDAARAVLVAFKAGRIEQPSVTIDGLSSPEQRSAGSRAAITGDLHASPRSRSTSVAPSSHAKTSDLASPAEDKRTALSSKALELGRSFLSSFFMAIRTAQIHDASNRAFRQALSNVFETASALYASTNGFSIRFVDETAFLNGTRLRFEGRTFETMRTLRDILEAQGLGGVQLKSPPTYEAIEKMVLLFAPANPAAPRGGITKADLEAAAIQVIGVQSFGDKPVEEMRVDRGVFALHCYAKLILACRDQRERMQAEGDTGQTATTAPSARIRAVRIAQDLVELCADRADFLLRLSENRSGPSLEELRGPNVCLRAIALGHALGFPRQDLVDVGIAALFADIGAVTDDEIGTMVARNRVFAKLLDAGGVLRSSLLRAVVVGELGVPHSGKTSWGRERPQRHPYTRLVAVARAYETARTLARSESAVLGPIYSLDALQSLVADGSGKIDLRFSDLLLNVLRAFPVGTRVLLDGGEHAEVTNLLGNARWDRPMVRLENGRELDLMTKAGGRFISRIIGTVFSRTPLPRTTTNDLWPMPKEAPIELDVSTLVELPEEAPSYRELEDDAGYRVLSELRREGEAIVYEGTDETNARVWIKVLDARRVDHPLTFDEHAALMLRESELAFRVAHDALPIRLYASRTGDCWFLVYQAEDGVPLSEAIDSRELELGDVNTIGAHLSSALAHLHQLGVSHGNVGVESVLFRKDRTPFIRDLSRASTDGAHPLLRGNLASQCPELLTGSGYTVRSDQFALGVLLYRAATGEDPFGAIEGRNERLLVIDPLPPSALNPALSDAFDAAIMRMLAKDPIKRFPTMHALSAELLNSC